MIPIASSTSGSGQTGGNSPDPNGAPDATFGTGGKATVDFPVAGFGNAVARQPNGRIVVAGQRRAGEDFAVARLLG